MLVLLLAIVAGVFIHVSAMALTATFSGIRVTKISYGVGPELYTSKLVDLKLLFCSGFVSMQSDTNPDVEYDLEGASYENKNYFTRVFISLSGCILLIILSSALLGGFDLNLFYERILIVIKGAVSPINDGMIYISLAHEYITSSTWTDIFGMVFLTIAAVNLLPLPTLNGGQPIMELLSPESPLREKLYMVGLILILLLVAAWLIAIGNYVVEAWN